MLIINSSCNLRVSKKWVAIHLSSSLFVSDYTSSVIRGSINLLVCPLRPEQQQAIQPHPLPSVILNISKPNLCFGFAYSSYDDDNNNPEAKSDKPTIELPNDKDCNLCQGK